VASETTVTGAIAGRYAAAIYDLADENKALDEIAKDLSELSAMIAASADLRRLLRSPLVGREEQTAAMAALLESAGLSDITRRFIGVVARNRRLFALEAIIAAYLRELAERRGEVTAEVTSAVKLSEEQAQSVAEALRKAVGAKVSVDLHVDPGLLGGLVVKVGSRMVDSSLRTKLQRLQLVMKGTG